MHAHGGFDISKTPKFSIGMALWLQLGGVYAVSNTRGGGEYGSQWYLKDRSLEKQNSFDDFIVAAEYLSEKNILHQTTLLLKEAQMEAYQLGQ